ncbi:MAG: cation-transporting P-type ATPase [Planctomycetes bacterium]|nr:cation-transporting P-type ATPase [Planctomycetota bacterium]MCB9891607.1 cation-transporting P-type ATPase [Planctomycetota bacterium]MCB9917896.1 cation-transporting P-type ATPase [Planctomycetota bacterium]
MKGPLHAKQQADLRTPWAGSPTSVLTALESCVDGLTEREAHRRLERYGKNALQVAARRSSWLILRDQFASPITWLLVVAAVLALAFGEHIESAAIIVVIVINAAIGFWTEHRALRSMEALRELGRQETVARREGHVRSIPAEDLVPGDIIILDAGDVLTADVRLLEASRLMVDESTLTGESLPVSKTPDPVDVESLLADRTSMLFKGTAITRGSAEAVVVATGMNTELGTISSLVETAEASVTPLETRLARLARTLVFVTCGIAVVIAILFIAGGREAWFALEIAIALAVATIPEGLPIVATLALARGMRRMAEHGALVEKLAAVETLGSTTTILTDKTGTLTENRMTAVEIRLDRGRVTIEGTGLETVGGFRLDDRAVRPRDVPELIDALRTAVLCNNASLDISSGTTESAGDPTEVALLIAGHKAGLTREALRAAWPEVREIAFDSESKRMATLHDATQRDAASRVHTTNGNLASDARRYVAAVKGAPEAIVPCCTHVRGAARPEALTEAARSEWLAAAERMAAKGERVLALASSQVATPDAFAFEDLTLLGLVAFFDPPRANARKAIEEFHRAGIRVVMVTGDHASTAWNVASAVGLVDEGDERASAAIDGRQLGNFATESEERTRDLLSASVFARVDPRAKLDLIDLHQRSGAVVAMTGDGVNDAPALEKADIGVAMGLRGTQVACDAADIVLQNDELGTIVVAIEVGRTTFDNLRKFVVYLMSCNVSEVLVVAAGAIIAGPQPLLPLQILFLNFVTDVFPALALGACEGSRALMFQPPRDPREPLLTRHHWTAIFAFGALIAAVVLGAMHFAVGRLDATPERAAMIAFLTLAFAQLWHVFSMRNPSSGWIVNEVTRNRWIWGALVLCSLLVFVAVFVRPLARVLSLVDPRADGWALALGASLVPFALGQVWQAVAPSWSTTRRSTSR